MIALDNANADIYIGTNAGAALMERLNCARKSVDVVSPYLSNTTVKKLISLANAGIMVRLVTNKDFGQSGKKDNVHQDDTQSYFPDYVDNVKNFYKQIRIEHKEQKERKERLEQQKARMGTAIVLLIAVGCVVGFLTTSLWVLFTLAPIFILGLLMHSYADDITNIEVYEYRYQPLFEVKIFRDYSKTNPTYVHSKVYVIDEEVAFLGSLNFTEVGINSSYETRVKVTDKKAVKKIKEYVDDFFYKTPLDMGLWGVNKELEARWQKFYSTPKN